MSNEITRRDLLKGAGVLGAGVLAAQMGLSGSARAQAAAGAGKSFKIGVIGCGGRGTGAIENNLEAAKAIGVNVEVYALCDYFMEKAQNLAKKHNVAAERVFSGADGYHKLLALPVDLVILATAPLFRPIHLEAAIKAGKNVFFEKPVAVDPPGVRRVIAAGKEAQGKGLCIVAGTQRRHQSNYLKNKFAIDNGAIGKLMGGQVSWCGGALWVRPRTPEQSDADYMVNNWGNFAGMSGDHIVEQHIHNIDVANWFIGRHPVQAIGFGGRARRKTGDQYDFFDVDYDYGENLHIHSMCRQVPNCYSKVDEFFVGTEGTTFGGGKMVSAKLESLKVPAFETHQNGQVQEHIDLFKAILEGKPNSETEALNVATSTLTVIMGRISAYTGQVVRWSDLMENEASPLFKLTMLPTAEDFEKGPVTAPKDDVIPIPGSEATPRAAGMGGKGKGKGKGKKKANAA